MAAGEARRLLAAAAGDAQDGRMDKDAVRQLRTSRQLRHAQRLNERRGVRVRGSGITAWHLDVFAPSLRIRSDNDLAIDALLDLGRQQLLQLRKERLHRRIVGRGVGR